MSAKNCPSGRTGMSCQKKKIEIEKSNVSPTHNLKFSLSHIQKEKQEISFNNQFSLTQYIQHGVLSTCNQNKKLRRCFILQSFQNLMDILHLQHASTLHVSVVQKPHVASGHHTGQSGSDREVPRPDKSGKARGLGEASEGLPL